VATLPALLARLDVDDRVRGRQWERICQWWLRNDPAYRPLLRRVWLWREWPGRWGADAGIDLVAEDVEGHLWAVQAKRYDPSYTVTKRDLDTFLSESSRPQFSYRLLVATTDLLAPNARRVVEGSEKPVRLRLRGDLERAQVEWPDDPVSPAAPAFSPKTPRPHQEEALAAVVAGFEAHDRGQLIMACGTGKTLVGLWAAEALAATRSLVLLPSLSLLASEISTARPGRETAGGRAPGRSGEGVAMESPAKTTQQGGGARARARPAGNPTLLSRVSLSDPRLVSAPLPRSVIRMRSLVRIQPGPLPSGFPGSPLVRVLRACRECGGRPGRSTRWCRRERYRGPWPFSLRPSSPS